MNIRDSEFVAGVLVDNGFRLVDSPQDADVVLFNSCSVRKHAEDRLFSNILCLTGLKKKRPALVIGLMGCTAQARKSDVFGRAPIIDLVCGPGNESDLPALIQYTLKHGSRLVAVDKVDKKRPELFPGYRQGEFKAQVSIGEGCDNYCSYCIVPYVRGRERSRDAKDIVREVRDLAARGFKEITLLGQNVNSYNGLRAKGEGMSFIKLLESLNKIDGIERIRFMTSHPKDAHAELFKAMRDLGKVCEHLHLPLQSGSDRILKLMNRKYGAKKYMKLVECYRKHVPDGSITTDLVVGFPSETESDFRKTYRMMERVRFDSAFTFKYSPRPPAKAARLEDDVPEEAKAARLKGVIELQRRCSLERNMSLAGKAVEILADGVSRKDAAFLSGRTRTNKTAVFKGDSRLIGTCVNITVESAAPYALKGRLENLDTA